MKVKMKLKILNSTRTKVTGMIVSRMEQGSITTMNRSYPLKLFFKLDTDQGFEGQSVSMDDLYNTCQ